jgi:hypothetical protein
VTYYRVLKPFGDHEVGEMIESKGYPEGAQKGDVIACGQGFPGYADRALRSSAAASVTSDWYEEPVDEPAEEKLPQNYETPDPKSVSLGDPEE